ncbi:GTPase-activating protein, putative [Plasmodium vinckei vinckei]|uniref:GTPase-activating protein, putative n=1 Tax=Plasmodium vinckei vinckei TaxID=54757 RepID=A0A449BTP0_PLAVN|nr:GTPase-activating protein, putative [Plasmodium vinckei vinckei]VEV56762.1 GTPase-activating protein, putative [Plasmodium vinckei vinckei]
MNNQTLFSENTSNNINDKTLEFDKQNGNKLESRVCPKNAQYISERMLSPDNKFDINKTQNADSLLSTEMSIPINKEFTEQDKKHIEELEKDYNINKNKDIYPKLGEEYCKSIDEENEYLEEWDVVRKRIFDPTLGLRKHYAKELLSCGEKNNTRILEKWSSMINRNINWFMKAHKTTFIRRVKRGIPQKYRWKVWMHITNSISLVNKFEKRYYYLYKKTSNYSNLIYIDISRTFPELLIFDKYAQEQLYRILNAYANYESSVGYCQGMNFIVGLLLIVSNFNELETFCVLVSLMDNYHLKNFYKEKFPLLNRFIYVFEKILKFEVPDLFEHFNNEEVHPPVYLHQWLLTLFIASLPIKSVIVIWDYLFSTSIKMILIISVALLKILKNYLIKNNFEKILKLLKSMKYNESNDDILIAKLLIKKSELVILNTGLAYIFENIEREDIPLDVKFKFSINNITNFHFKTVTPNYSKNEIENDGNQNNISQPNNTTFSDLDGVSLLNFFSTNILPKSNFNQVKEDKELKQDANYDLKAIEKTESQNNINEIYYKMLSSNEKNQLSESDNDLPSDHKIDDDQDANQDDNINLKQMNFEKHNSINNKNDRKKNSDNIKRHAYYKSSQNNDDPFCNNYVIQDKTKQARQKISEEEKNDIYFTHGFKNENKQSQTNLTDKTKNKKQFKYNDKDKEQDNDNAHTSDSSEELPYTTTNGDKEESILNISDYIDNNKNSNPNNEGENNSEENGLSFFNMIQSYAKDNNWFDVSSINKYYNFNKGSSDLELDSMGINKKDKFGDSN